IFLVFLMETIWKFRDILQKMNLKECRIIVERILMISFLRMHLLLESHILFLALDKCRGLISGLEMSCYLLWVPLVVFLLYRKQSKWPQEVVKLLY
ncbi:hypothetical protein CPT76_35070, partial [Paenibacillus sp. AR247]